MPTPKLMIILLIISLLFGSLYISSQGYLLEGVIVYRFWLWGLSYSTSFGSRVVTITDWYVQVLVFQKYPWAIRMAVEIAVIIRFVSLIAGTLVMVGLLKARKKLLRLFSPLLSVPLIGESLLIITNDLNNFLSYWFTFSSDTLFIRFGDFLLVILAILLFGTSSNGHKDAG